ncbi:hypothetical protein TEA_029983 [Camellia sinensis var. sinensis]|uniref:SPARK domain-containing protein n=1 Tax=Camellia sinensis var. sinensis TaxID=542762 RepID=A0A4S4CXS7_CAMSN|nr:hypothetical protein TEA_029983 [Camellia sinensis var. sinensis]
MIFSIKSLSSLLLPIFLVLSSTTYSFSHGASQNLYLQTLHIPGTSNESEYGVVSWGMKRSVLEGNNGEAAQKSSLILAAERTHRKDPLDNLNLWLLPVFPCFSPLQSGLLDSACLHCSSVSVVAAANDDNMAILEQLMHFLSSSYHCSPLLHIVGDTCTAMDEWAQNPTAHTALDDILPCVDSTTAQQTLSQSKEVNFQLVGIVNGIITNVSNINAPSPGAAHPLYYNQSGPLVPVLCNPFNSDKSARICAAGEVDFNNATQVWKNYVCQVSASNICNTTGRLTPQMYEQMESVVNVNYGLYHYSPFLIGLLDCSFVRDTFSSISVHQCPDLSRYSKWIYIGFAIVSAAVMLSLIFWVVYARERQHRKYTKLSKAASDGDSFGQKRP